MGGNELEVLEHYNRKIQKYGDLDNTEVLIKCLGKLDQVRVNILLLQQTGIGRTVSAIKKKYGDSEIGSKSRDLVNKWKELVAKEEEEEEEEVVNVPDEPAVVTDDPPTYVPTPIAPAYIPTPIDKLKESVEENGNSDIEATSEGEVKRQGELNDDDHHKSKKKKSHRESDKEENGKSSRSDTDKNREKSNKHHNSDKSRDSKHSDRVSKDKDNCDKNKERNGEKERDDKSHSHKGSSKSSRKESSSESSSKSDRKHSEKEKHRTKDNEVRIKEEKEDNDSSKHRPKKEGSNGDVRVKSEPGIIKVKTEPGISVSSFDFMKGETDKSAKEKKDKKERDKRRDESSSKSSHHKKSSSKSNGVEDMFSKALGGVGEESSKKKRSLEDYRDSEDISKHKKSRRESEAKASRPSSPPSASYKPTPSSLIPDISPMYKPLPRQPIISAPEKKSVTAEDDEESLAILLANKNKNRSAIFSGTKRQGFMGDVPSLFSQCLQVLKDHVDEIDEVGNLTFDILEPVLKQATPTTLMHIEDCNPYLMEDTAELWRKFVEKTFRSKEREEMESWREMWERCHEEREEKLNMLKGRVKQSYKTEDEKHLKTKMAYVDIAPKAPRIVRNAQAKHGTALPVGHSMVAGAPRPRNQMGDPTARAVRDGHSSSSKKPKTAPMMQKTMKLMRSLKGGFRR